MQYLESEYPLSTSLNTIYHSVIPFIWNHFEIRKSNDLVNHSVIQSVGTSQKPDFIFNASASDIAGCQEGKIF